jgi:hypothetical protein
MMTNNLHEGVKEYWIPIWCIVGIVVLCVEVLT